MAAELVDPGYWDHAPQVRGVTTLMPIVKAEDIFPKCVCVSNFSTRCGATLTMLGLLGSVIPGPVRNQVQFSGIWYISVKPLYFNSMFQLMVYTGNAYQHRAQTPAVVGSWTQI